MKAIVGLLPALVLAACWQNGASGPVFEARTAHVYDGDSFLVKRGRNEIEVRLYGIDAPEKSQPWSGEARAGLNKLIGREWLRIEPVEQDRYGRVVARVYRVRDDLYVNAEMIGNGHAWVYRRYTDERLLIRREKRARSEPAGLWRLPAGQRIPPWEWRQERETE